MNYIKLIIHPLGDANKVAPIIGEVVDSFKGIFQPRRLLGIPSFTASFPDGELAANCMKKLEQMDEVSHVEWEENS